MLKIENISDELHLSGSFDENAELVLGELLKTLATSLTINCRNVNQINSFGARIWINFLVSASKKTSIKLKECSEIFMNYRALISGMSHGCDILSLVVKYECNNCGTSRDEIIQKADFSLEHKFEVLPCKKCSKPTSASVDSEELFSFLEE